MTRLITFTDQNMTIAADICVKSALANNVDEAKIYGPGDIDRDFYDSNIEIFKQPRGYGYWLWKPYFIDRELKEMKDGDYLVYSDAGVELINNINHIIDRMQDDVWLFGNKWQHAEWCKGDALEQICPLKLKWSMWFDGNNTQIRYKQCQASVIFIRCSKSAKYLVSEWLKYCQVPSLIDDSESKESNYPTFSEHRHDQALLTCVAIRNNIALHWWPAMYNAGNFTYEKTGYTDSYPVLFHHHRMRNEQFLSNDDLDVHMQKYFFTKYRNLFKKLIEREWRLRPNEKWTFA